MIVVFVVFFLVCLVVPFSFLDRLDAKAEGRTENVGGDILNILRWVGSMKG